MPVNDKKPITPDAIVNEVLNAFLTGFGTPAAPKAETEEPAVDSLKETYRLLKKAEDTTDPEELVELLQIADRHLRILDLALSSQR